MHGRILPCLGSWVEQFIVETHWLYQLESVLKLVLKTMTVLRLYKPTSLSWGKLKILLDRHSLSGTFPGFDCLTARSSNQSWKHSRAKGV